MRGYYKVLKEVFEELGTKPHEWEPNMPESYIEEKPIYSKPYGMKRLEPYYDKHPEEAQYHSEGYPKNCQLCGHYIKNIYLISHKQKQLFTFVGSECINNYWNCDIKKEAKEIILRKAYQKWKPQAVKFFWRSWWLCDKWQPPEDFELLNKINNDEPKTKRQIKHIFKKAKELGWPVPSEVMN